MKIDRRRKAAGPDRVLSDVSVNENRSEVVPSLEDDLLCALNAELRIPRQALCRLARRRLDEPRSTVESLARGIEHEVVADTLRRARSVAATERERAAELGARIVTCLSEDYPPELLRLELPPPVLYLRGRLAPSTRLAVVGSRHADRWALDFAAEVAEAAARSGFPVVSGFALGVDIAAHRAAAAVGSSVAVLGCGLLTRYPRAHVDFADELVERGAVVSELPLDAKALPHNFPVRNRIIAALARCTLVVQAAARSGALITARNAVEMGLDVLAVPGRPTDARSAGTNRLLRDGAHVVLEPADVLGLLGLQLPRSSEEGATATRDPLLRALDDGEATLEELVVATGTAASEVQARLLDLELDGLVDVSAGRYRRRRP